MVVYLDIGLVARIIFETTKKFLRGGIFGGFNPFKPCVYQASWGSLNKKGRPSEAGRPFENL